MSTAGQKIKARRKELGLEQAELATDVGTKQQTIDKIERGITKKSSYFPRIAARLGMDLKELDPDLQRLDNHDSSYSLDADRASQNNLSRADADLPIYAAAQGGEGTVIVTVEPVDWKHRGTPLASVRGGYGLIVTGDSMVPVYRSGQIVLVNPHLSPRPEDGIILYGGEVVGEVKATIKEYVGQTANEWILRRYQPEVRTFRLKKAEWPVVHVVVGTYSR